MKQMIEGFVTAFLVILSALVLVQFIGASMQIRNARQFHHTCIGEIESSDFDRSVIEGCAQKAEERGYTLEVQYMKESGLVCTNCNSSVDENTMVCENCQTEQYVSYLSDRLCEITLSYGVKMAFVNIEKEGVLSGYAR